MFITLRDFVDLAIESVYDCFVYDVEKGKRVFNGTLYDIPQELLDADFESWEIEGDNIGFNVSL